jgi:S-adenosylmethionine-diacylglycerol 3-amino-3-carboxypropyl transferase
MSNQFFNKINYSACNEDSESELQALSLTKSDTLLCITASGARPLDLLIGKPKKIISIDFNRTQNYLLSLKIAAYKTLNYSEFLSFIGVNNNKTREVLYNRVTL